MAVFIGARSFILVSSCIPDTKSGRRVAEVRNWQIPRTRNQKQCRKRPNRSQNWPTSVPYSAVRAYRNSNRFHIFGWNSSRKNIIWHLGNFDKQPHATANDSEHRINPISVNPRVQVCLPRPFDDQTRCFVSVLFKLRCKLFGDENRTKINRGKTVAVKPQNAHFYLRQRGTVSPGVCLSVCLSVC